jgi:hypothetical protein
MVGSSGFEPESTGPEPASIAKLAHEPSGIKGERI